MGMKLNNLGKWLPLVALSVVSSWAASSTVGVIKADGLFTVNNAEVEECDGTAVNKGSGERERKAVRR
jgi:hypothetical protein